MLVVYYYTLLVTNRIYTEFMMSPDTGVLVLTLCIAQRNLLQLQITKCRKVKLMVSQCLHTNRSRILP